MDRLLSFLLFAAFFYLMMRFGCGAHMVHGNHGGHGHEGHQGADKGSAKDSVCGMPSNPANPNIGLRERSCIVDTVACHRYHMAFGLQSLHDFALLVG